MRIVDKYVLAALLLLSLMACSDGQAGSGEVAIGQYGGELRTEVLQVPGLAPQPITYEWVDGKAIFQGDIPLDLPRLRAAMATQVAPQSVSPSGDLTLQSTGRGNEAARWINGVVPYTINGDPNATVTVINGITNSAMYVWSHTLPQIQFVRRTTEPDYINFVTGASTPSCLSDIGRQGGVQTISLPNFCLTNIRYVAHEIGHALGLWHEMQRSDRDGWITVNWSNISDPSQYKTYVELGFDGFDNHSTFDFTSIMLYGSYALAKNINIPTATRKDGTTWSEVNFPSAGDYQAVGRMYPYFSNFADGSSFVQTVSSLYPPGITSWGPGRLDVVAANGAGQVIHQYYNNGVWSGWVDNWGGVVTTGIDITSWGANRLDLVTRGTDGQVYHFFWDGTVPGVPAATGWDALGLVVPIQANGTSIDLYRPSICSEGPGSLDVWAVGSDGQAYSRGYRGGAGGWRPNWTQSISGTLNSGIDCVASAGRNDVVSRNSQGHALYASCTGVCTNWQDLGGVLMGRPTIASWQPGHYDVFGQGTDFNMYKRSFQNSWNLGWSLVGGIGYVPDVVSWGPARFDMVVRNPRSIVGWGFVQN